MKLYQLTVLRSKEEEEQAAKDDEITIPSVDNIELLQGTYFLFLMEMFVLSVYMPRPL